MFSRQKSFLLVVLLLLWATGCATYKSRRIDIRPVNEYPNLSIAEGISVAADPYGSGTKAEQGFDRDVTREGFVPVNLIVRNDTDEQVRINREKIALIDENEVVYRPVSSNDMSDKFKKNVIAHFLAGSVISVAVGVVSSVSAILANRKMKADWQRKEIPDQLVLQPGKQIHGFVYFKLPQGQTTTVSKLYLESERLNSGKTVRVELTPRDNESIVTISPPDPREPKDHSITAANP
ncbi:MAG: hypothetical protein GTN74_00555 [Proteobacteria bacterium]|nr:hypothetical protein [Pseudomonadota bacterium]NIS67504.1 hypothetical protein [Pseudomonadota bacterium]